MTPDQPQSPDMRNPSSHKSKKRKVRDREDVTASKKLKYLDPALEVVEDTPVKNSGSKKKSKSTTRHIQESSHEALDEDTETHLPPISSPYHTVTATLYLPVPPIALSPITALPSLVTTHLSPLLLTYYPPLRGVALAISNPVLSSRRPAEDTPPQPPSTEQYSQNVLATCSDDAGLSYIWLTATFLLFMPQIGDELEGFVNVCSDGFVGLVCCNYFQVAVARDQIPRGWTWIPPEGEVDTLAKKKKKKKKGKGPEEEDEASSVVGMDSQMTMVNGEHNHDDYNEDNASAERESGFFIRDGGIKVEGLTRFKVVDLEAVPGPDRESWSLQVEGTFLFGRNEQSQFQEGRRQTISNSRRG